MSDPDNTPSSPFGRGWIPAARAIGLPDDGAEGEPSAMPDTAALNTSIDVHPNPSHLAVGISGAAPTPAANLPAVRHDAFTPERQARFLQGLSVGGSVRSACASVGISAQAAYLCRRRSAHFAAGWDAALVLARDHAEQVLAERALDGVDEAVFYHGEQVATRRRFDGRLLLAHLARLDARVAADPEARRRAGRFDELLATLSGEEPAGIEPQPWRRDHDPFLPPARPVHVAQSTDGLGPRAYPRARQRAEAEWDHWRAAAEARVDRLAEAPPSRPPAEPGLPESSIPENSEREYKSAHPPRTALTGEGQGQEPGERRAKWPTAGNPARGAPHAAPKKLSPRTLSTSSTPRPPRCGLHGAGGGPGKGMMPGEARWGGAGPAKPRPCLRTG